MPSKIRKRGENSYELAVSAGLDETGRQKVARRTVYAENDTEAKGKWIDFKSEVQRGLAPVLNKDKMTVKQFYDYWKEKHANARYAKSTLSVYETMFVRIEAGLGHLYLHKMKPRHILEFMAQLNAPDASKDDTPLTDRTIMKHYELLRLLFTAAYKWKFIPENIIQDIDAPRMEHRQKEIPSEEGVKRFFEVLQKAPLKNQLACLLMFSGGLRREEVHGLKWGDLDFDKNTVTISRAAVYVAGTGIEIKSTKTAASRRTISLPPSIMRMLAKYQQEVKALYKRRAKRRKVVLLDDPIASDKWVFTAPDGSIGHPHQTNNFLKRFCEDNHLENFTPHILRHLHGSYLLQSGIDLAAVSQKLGHTKKSFTADVYIHAIQSVEQQTAVVMEGILTNLTDKNTKGQA